MESGTAATAAAAAAAAAAGLAASANEKQQQLGGCLVPMLPAALLSATGRSSATFSTRPIIVWPWSGPRSCLISAATATAGAQG